MMDPNQNPVQNPQQPQGTNETPVQQPQQAYQQPSAQPQPYPAEPFTKPSSTKLYLLIGLAVVGIILVVTGTVIPASEESQRVVNRALTGQDVLKDGVRVVGFLLLVISSGLLVKLKKKAK